MNIYNLENEVKIWSKSKHAQIDSVKICPKPYLKFKFAQNRANQNLLNSVSLKSGLNCEKWDFAKNKILTENCSKL